MSYDVCYIDDHLLPFGAEIANEHSLISKTEIENSLTKPNWDEPTVQRFLSNTLKKGKKFNQLELSGFLNPDFFLNYIAESDYKPNTIVLDWDFTTSKAEQKINEIIQQTDSKIFVLTGNDLKPEVEAVLKPFKDAHQNRIFDVYKKTSGIHQFEKATQENLLEEIIADLTTIEEVYEYAGTEISFYPSFILPNFDWFWMLESILGSNFIKEYIVENSLLISQATIEKMFDDSEVMANED